MTLQSRIWWIVVTVLATMFVGGELLDWKSLSTINPSAAKRGQIVAPQAINVERVAHIMGYPEKAMRAGIQGQVLLRIWVNESGTYTRHEVLEADHPLLKLACEVYAPMLEFKPGTLDGEPIPSYLDVPFRFSMK